MTTLLAQNLVTDFWLEVVTILTQKHNATPQKAFQASQEYRQKLAEQDADEWIYHRSPADVAADIKSGGFLD